LDIALGFLFNMDVSSFSHGTWEVESCTVGPF